MNRRTYDYCYQQYCNALKNNDLKNLSLILIDIDDFKKINDEFGHGMGDKVLSHLSRILFQVNTSNLCRRVYRYGGEEFVILLTESSLFDACDLAEDIRTTIEHLSATLFIQYNIHVSISCGVVSSDNMAMDCDFFEYADKAMYHAKKNKKNCVYYFYNNKYMKFTRETVGN